MADTRADSILSLEQQILMKNRDFIIKYLDVDDIIDKLTQACLISVNDASKLVGKSKVDKNRIVFQQLSNAGSGALEKFCKILRNRRHKTTISEELEKRLHTDFMCKNVPSMKSSTIDVSKLKTWYLEHLSPNDDRNWEHHYVRLVLVKQEEIKRTDKNLEEATKLTLQGQIDELALKKEPLGELIDIFHYQNKPCPHLILILGGPGIGKTTLANKICVKWARDGFLSEDFDIVILIQLRSVQQKSLEAVMIEHSGKETYELLNESGGARSLIILEGLDELSFDCQQNDPFFIQLIKECVIFKKATIIITSRPHACKEIVVGRTIEIVGFGNKEIEEFVRKKFSNDKQSFTEFLQHLNEFPHLHSLCYVPINLEMIMNIFKCSQNRLPSTLTELYQQFIVMNLERQVLKCKEKNPEFSAEISPATNGNGEILCKLLIGIPVDTIKAVLLLCKLSYCGFFEWYSRDSWRKFPKVVFAESDLIQCGINVTNPLHYESHGFLKAVHTYPTSTSTYNFTHLTIQEFFAAIHISTLSQEEKFHLLREHFCDYPIVFVFLCGLTGLVCTEMFQFVCSKLLSEGVNFWPANLDIVTAVRCIYESKQTSLNQSTPITPFILSLSSNTLLPYDCLCISYLLSCFPVTQLLMWNCSIGDKGAEMLTKHYPSKNLTGQLLEVLEIDINNFTIAGLETVMAIVKTCYATLKILRVGGNLFGDDGMQLILKGFQDNNVLVDLGVWRCKLSSKGTTDICNLLKITNTLKVVTMDHNKIGDDGMFLISEGLQCNHTLTSLSVRNCGFSVKGAIYFSKALTLNHTLKEVNLWGNEIGDDGITAIAEALKNSKISLLNVRECGISFVGAKSLAEGLSVNDSIKELWIMNNPITVEGACLIVHAVVQNTVCQEVLIDDDYENTTEIKKMMELLDNRKKQDIKEINPEQDNNLNEHESLQRLPQQEDFTKEMNAGTRHSRQCNCYII